MYQLIKKTGLILASVLTATCLPGQDFREQALTAIQRKTGIAREQLLVTDHYRSAGSGATHVYLQQVIEGAVLRGATASVHFDATGSPFHLQEHLSASAAKARVTDRKINERQAIEKAGLHLRRTPQLPPHRQKTTPQYYTHYAVPALSAFPLIVRPGLEAGHGGLLRPVWEVQVVPPDQEHAWLLVVDAIDGSIRSQTDLMTHCRFHHPEYYPDDNDWVKTPDPISFIHSERSTAAATTAVPLNFAGSYEAFHLPEESPLYSSGLTIASGASLIDPAASPNGWHDTGSQSYTYTRGNNIYAYYDPANIANPTAVPIVRNNGVYVSGNVPDGGPTLTFEFNGPVGSVNPTDYLENSITNAFVTTNRLHDLLFRYGFDEPSGNFQQTNFSNTGLGNDFLLAESQNGSGVANFNDANFFTPPDGLSPFMQLYLWTGGLPSQSIDVDFDNAIIAHEYAHGLSFRLVGGPATNACLTNIEQGGEGYSDFFGLLLTMQDADGDGILEEHVPGEGVRGIGTYPLNQTPNERGLRPAYYATSFAFNDYTYADLNGLVAPHGVGFLWCTMLWDLTWELIDLHGYEANLYQTTSTAGNIRALKLVVEALRLTPCEPSFIDMRDAIFAADNLLNDGAHEDLLWQVFARRGLGFSAAAGGQASFDLPDIRLEKSADRSQILRGETINYTIQLFNNSGQALSNVRIEDPISPYLENIDASDGGTVQNGTLAFPAIASVPDGTTVTRTFSARVRNTAPFTQVLYENNVEGITTDFVPTPFWELNSGNPNSGNNAWFHPNDGAPVQGALILNLILDGSQNNHLSFWHEYDLETFFDGGVVEISTNAGVNWEDLGPRIIQNGYTHALTTRDIFGLISSPLDGRRAFSGSSGGYINTLIDLSGYSGAILVRFFFAADDSGGATGWWLDDFQLLDFVKLENTACVYLDQDPNPLDCASVADPATTIFEQTVLPVTWLDFRARARQDFIRLEWRTALEINNSGYEIQRRSDREQAFQVIGWQTGRGSVFEETAYQWDDREALPGRRYYYRLRQLDQDGKDSFSAVVSAQLNGPAALEGWPNPATDQFTLHRYDSAGPTAGLFLYDATGRLVRRESWPPGSSDYSLDIHDLPPGLYLLQTSAPGEGSTLHFVKH